MRSSRSGVPQVGAEATPTLHRAQSLRGYGADEALIRKRVLTDRELAAVYRTALKGEDSFSHIVALLILKVSGGARSAHYSGTGSTKMG